jgi:hypothetical protein
MKEQEKQGWIIVAVLFTTMFLIWARSTPAACFSFLW